MAEGSVIATEGVQPLNSDLLEGWIEMLDQITDKLLSGEDRLYLRYYGGFALNVLLGQRLLPKGASLFEQYRAGTVPRGPAPQVSDVDAKLYGIPATQELRASEHFLKKLKSNRLSFRVPERIDPSLARWISSLHPLSSGEPYVTLDTYSSGKVMAILAGRREYRKREDAFANPHYQIQIGVVLRESGKFMGVTDITMVQEPLPMYSLANRVDCLDLPTLRQQFIVQLAALQAMQDPSVRPRIQKTQSRIQILNAVFEEIRAEHRALEEEWERSQMKHAEGNPYLVEQIQKATAAQKAARQRLYRANPMHPTYRILYGNLPPAVAEPVAIPPATVPPRSAVAEQFIRVMSARANASKTSTRGGGRQRRLARRSRSRTRRA
jgi:hypothetical protein